MQPITLNCHGKTFAGLTNGGMGPRMLALHGYLDNAASFLPLAPHLAEYELIALDLAGHGHSFHRSSDAHYHLLDYVQDVVELITSQGWQDVILVGHSLGGILATLTAAVLPECIAAVVSIDAAGPVTENAATSAEQLKSAIQSRLPKTSGRQKARLVKLEDMVKARCHITDISSDYARLIIERNLMLQDADNYTWRSDPKLRTKSVLRLTDSQAKALMAAIKCPVLICGATTSFKQLPLKYPHRKSWWQNVQYKELEGGHHIHMEKSSQIGQIIRHFVEDL